MIMIQVHEVEAEFRRRDYHPGIPVDHVPVEHPPVDEDLPPIPPVLEEHLPHVPHIPVEPLPEEADRALFWIVLAATAIITKDKWLVTAW